MKMINWGALKAALTNGVQGTTYSLINLDNKTPLVDALSVLTKEDFEFITFRFDPENRDLSLEDIRYRYYPGFSRNEMIMTETRILDQLRGNEIIQSLIMR